MTNVRQRSRVVLGMAVLFVLLLIGAVPQRYIPERLCPVVTEEGTFEGKPIRVPTPKGEGGEVTARITIKMDRGMWCRGRFEKQGAATGLFNIAEGHCLARIPIGSELVLDPQGEVGDYGVTIGPEWHPLGPKGRRFILLPIGVSSIAALTVGGKVRSQTRKLGAKRFLFLLGVAVVNGLILYPVLHEGGHVVFGMLRGAKPDWEGVVWTCLSGQEPHASFASLPPGAGPLMSAGGHILPTVAALLLLLAWRLFYKNASWYFSAALLWVPLLILFSTLGCLFELNQQSHMDALAVGFGLSGPLRIGFSLSPLLVAIAAYLWVGIRLKGRS
jgi:hypothetical protein